ncbi:hypothetical protein ACMDCR_07590 [Labrys okinawensis]|uniref:hypothetical protein n=1 Tax=Labrys okinawensis TaxID=346911 RepID=UPI0039BC2F3B
MAMAIAISAILRLLTLPAFDDKARGLELVLRGRHIVNHIVLLYRPDLVGQMGSLHQCRHLSR